MPSLLIVNLCLFSPIGVAVAIAIATTAGSFAASTRYYDIVLEVCLVVAKDKLWQPV